MAPQKRKRPHDVSATESHVPAPAPARRATRQNPLPMPVADPESEPKHQLRSRRGRAKATDEPAVAALSAAEAREARNDASKSTAAPAPTRQTKTRTTRHSAGTEPISVATAAPDKEAKRQKENTRTPSPPRKAGKALRSPKYALRNDRSPPQLMSRPTPAPAPHKQTQTEKRSDSLLKTRVPPSKHSRQAPKTAAASSSTAPAATPKRPTSDKPPKPPPTPRSDRNIDKVVLGDICFRAWYPSYYGKEVLGDVSGNASSMAGAKIGGGKHRDPPMLDRLYVCPCCFKYSKELVLWWEHVRCCETKAQVPGRKIYTHPRGSRRGTRGLRVEGAGTGTETGFSGAGKGRGKRKADGGLGATAKTGEETVSDEGEWSVWEVDGEKDVLFCQNLSLFAKLFLDNKSVFFDVTGFNYFLLVYTPSASSATQPPLSLRNHTHAHSASPILSNPATADSNAQTLNLDPSSPTQGSSPPQQKQYQPQPLSSSSPSSLSPPAARPQIVGFFSKEKMSWDNNNLACILVFPPWQRKGLGALLMGVSYEISRREGILGGPEKPISELGRKGYKRFWAGEIARWLLGLEIIPGGGGAGNDNCRAEAEGEKISNNENGDCETLVDVEQCSRATWIVQEDCLAVLREMGVVEEAGVGLARGAGAAATTTTTSAAMNAATATATATTVPSPDVDMNRDERSDDGDGGGKGGVGVGVGIATSQGSTGKDKDRDRDRDREDREAGSSRLVPRVRIDKEAVRRWVRDNGVELSRTCDPAGFVAEGSSAVKNAGCHHQQVVQYSMTPVGSVREGGVDEIPNMINN
ncbi:acyl-CoA N-acyltransferase [Biscogniauxia marginata]|nr:acyl-CoA N-acyltransferase [Biscogniauxia marginata]